ncbi:hypothetical protein ACN38_g6836 [Penicillium nordicum]|uniref:Uncharacterized protein n=1 Tax=Penicillium nordicum TaxID=229535 RepID=A0A0M9WF43_9EURO|nr:hypothetical protein ACN38_g6836 [Penicillium nordicum]
MHPSKHLPKLDYLKVNLPSLEAEGSGRLWGYLGEPSKVGRSHLAPSTFHHGHLPPSTMTPSTMDLPSWSCIMTFHHDLPSTMDLLPWTHPIWTCHLSHALGHAPSTMVTFHHDPIHHGPSILVMHHDLPS